MSHAVLIQNPASVYDDEHGVHYNFPKQYLGMMQEVVGDWVVFYEGRQGAFGYTHVQKVTGLRPDPDSLLISHNKVDLPTVERLVNPRMRLMLDEVDPRHYPHPAYLKWHREKDYA